MTKPGMEPGFVISVVIRRMRQRAETSLAAASKLPPSSSKRRAPLKR
jgi:hypothetical protein